MPLMNQDQHLAEWEEFKAQHAHMHAVKELGKFYDVALAHFNGDVNKLHAKVGIQLKRLMQAGVALHDGEEWINVGLLNLAELGLNEEQITELQAIHKHDTRAHDANTHAAKELGHYMQEAITASGSMEAVVAKARAQMDLLEEQGVVLRDGAIIRTGLLNLEGLGLSRESAIARRAEIVIEQQVAAMKARAAAVAHPHVEPLEEAPLVQRHWTHGGNLVAALAAGETSQTLVPTAEKSSVEASDVSSLTVGETSQVQPASVGAVADGENGAKTEVLRSVCIPSVWTTKFDPGATKPDAIQKEEAGLPSR